VIIALLFFFIIGLGVVIGAELNAALAEPPTPLRTRSPGRRKSSRSRQPSPAERPTKPRRGRAEKERSEGPKGEEMTGLMAGKRGLIMGLANDKSLAWGIAKALGEQGAELAFSYQGEALRSACGRWPSSSAPTS
jgi:hypothetical protein